MSSSSPIPPPFYHLRPLFSSLSSLRYSPPSYSTPCTPYSLPYSEFPFCSLSAAPFGHQPNSTPCPFFLSYSFASRASTANEPRACQIQSHLLILRDLISARSCSFFPSYSPISLFSLQAAEPSSISFSLPTTVVNAGALVPLMHPSPRVTAPCGHRYSRFRRNCAQRITKKRAVT